MHGTSTVFSLTEFAYILIIIKKILVHSPLSDKFGKIYFDIY